MKKKIGLALLVSATLAIAETEIISVENGLTINDATFPSISKKKLKEIVGNTEPHISLKDFIEYERGKIKKNSIGEKKYLIPFFRLLHEIEMRQKLYNKKHNLIYIAKEKSLGIELTKWQYKKLIATLNMQDFLRLLNKYTGKNFVSKIIFNQNNDKIFYVGEYTNVDFNEVNKKDYFLLLPKNPSLRYIPRGCNDFDRAFLILKMCSEEKIAVNQKDFNLSMLDILELYKKLNKWNVDMSEINIAMLKMFIKKAQKVENFNYELAVKDLKDNPSYTTASLIEKDLNKILNGDISYSDVPDTFNGKENVVIFKPEEKLKNIMESLELNGNKYKIDNKYTNKILVKALVTSNSQIHDFHDLQRYIEQTTDYRIKIVGNKYIINKSKDVMVFPKREVLEQIAHYLSKAENEVLRAKIFKDDFAKESMIEDIEYIKGELK